VRLRFLVLVSRHVFAHGQLGAVEITPFPQDKAHVRRLAGLMARGVIAVE